MLVKDLISILQGLEENMPILGYDLHDLFCAKKLDKLNVQCGYYTSDLSSNRKKMHFIAQTKHKLKYVNIPDTIKTERCLFIG